MFNLLEQNSQFKRWLCAPDDKTGKLQAEFQLEKASTIGFVDIGKYATPLTDSAYLLLRVNLGKIKPSDILILPSALLPSASRNQKLNCVT